MQGAGTLLRYTRYAKKLERKVECAKMRDLPIPHVPLASNDVRSLDQQESDKGTVRKE